MAARVGTNPVPAPRPQTPARTPEAPATPAAPATPGWTPQPPVRRPVTELAKSADGTPIFKQADEQWGSRKLGKAGATIAQSGCAMTSSAMALSKVSGKLITPKDLDEWLDKNRGYAGDSLDWSRVGVGHDVNVTWEDVDFRKFDEQLAKGYPIVIGVDYKPGSAGGNNGTDHWVCITGRQVDERGRVSYLANDPGTGKVITLTKGRGRQLVCDGTDALGAYKTTGEVRFFSPA